MATKTVVTRIKNKVDTLAKWQAYTGTLLDGEIAVVRVPTGDTYTNPVTGASEPVVELLMKVGNGSTSFADLPWMSAKASDVYDWGKAKTVEFNTSTYKVEFKDASGASILAVDLTAIDARLDALESSKLADITVTNSTGNTTGVVQSVTKGSTGEVTVTYGTVATGDIANSAVTTAKIADKNVTTAKIADANVTTAKIADGNVTNAKIAAGVSSDKINIDANTTLTTKLGTMDAEIASKADAHNHDAYVNQKAFSNIAVSKSGGGTSTVTVAADTATDTVTFEGSNIKITGDATNDKVTFAVDTASSSAAGITKLYTSVGDSTDGTVTRKVVNDINTQVQTNKADITNLKTAVAGGVHFRGTVTAEPSASTTTVGDITIAVGDVVIYSGKEYICTAVTSSGPSWEQLGDVTRIGDLETKINGLDVTATNDVATTHKFVSQVTQTDGKVSVTYARPSASDISYGSSSDVNTKLSSIDAAIATKADSEHEHPSYVNQNAFSKIAVSGQTAVEADTATDTVTFVGSNVTITTDATNDKVTFAVAKADADGETGIVTLESSVVDQNTTAATSGAVYSVNTKAVDAQTRAGAIEADYVRFNSNDKKLYVGKSGADEIIFDCGGAE